MKLEALQAAATRTRAWIKTIPGHDMMVEWEGCGHSYTRRLALAVLYATRIRRNEIIAKVVDIIADTEK